MQKLHKDLNTTNSIVASLLVFPEGFSLEFLETQSRKHAPSTMEPHYDVKDHDVPNQC